MLENHVNALNELPARVGGLEVQLVELRRAVITLRDEFVSFRVEVRNEFASVRGEAGAMEERRVLRTRAGGCGFCTKTSSLGLACSMKV